MFLNNESARDVGSSCASMNRTGKTNAKKGPKTDYNAYKDFHDREIDAHILASFMKFAGMKSISGKLFNVFALFRGIVVLYDFGEGGGRPNLPTKIVPWLGELFLVVSEFFKNFFSFENYL